VRASAAQAARLRAPVRGDSVRGDGGRAGSGQVAGSQAAARRAAGRRAARARAQASGRGSAAASYGLAGSWLAGSVIAGSGIIGTEAGRRPVAYTPRRGTGLTGYERVLVRAGLGPVAGIDEAGRGACAGPLVVAAVAIDRWEGDTAAGIADSKVLTARAREAAFATIVRSALAWHVVVIEPEEIDRLGLHVCNVAGMRRALAGLAASPGYVLTDGFEVPGLAVPALAMWKGDQVAACVAAASIVAKVTRDRIMTSLHTEYPSYGFARHKGYSTPSHMAALEACGASPVHRRSFVNVSSRMGGARPAGGIIVPAENLEHADGVVLADGSVLAVDEGGDSPMVELIADSPLAAPGPGRASAEPAAWAPASAEGRT
jgi:ribonuclease HII